MGQRDNLMLPDKVRESFTRVMDALDKVRRALDPVSDVIAVRPGYAYPVRGEPVPSVVVAIAPGTNPVRADELARQFNVPVTVADATVEEQLARSGEAPSFSQPAATASPLEALLAGDEGIAFALPEMGSYTALDPPDLPLVEEEMDLTICVSPEAGWSELESFLAGIRSRLTAAMYQFTAPHIFEAVRAAVTPGRRTFELILHPIPEKPPAKGVKAHELKEEEQVLEPLHHQLKQRFDAAWATLHSTAQPDGLWASAYHIKVAVRDGNTVWLSSGNWQSSNQPNVHVFGEGAPGPDALPTGFQRNYNRDYHAVVENSTLASVFEKYIRRDVELSEAQKGGLVEFSLPDLFVPTETEAVDFAVDFAHPPKYFPPLVLKRSVKVQPLLTPDNYAAHVIDLINTAQQSVWFQNQYINFRGTGVDFPEFKLLVGALKAKIDASLEVRIICRNLMQQEYLDVLVAQGFPIDIFRFQPACHNKTIIVDGKVVMFGSHNWSNEGVKTNRDASLIFYDEEIAQYLAGVYEYDWNTLATAHPAGRRPRVARVGEVTPPGFERVSYSAVFDD
jgi:hypothetical protein